MMITGEMMATKAAELLNHTIPYVEGGMTLKGMDCQGVIRWIMKELGMALPAKKGTNYMWRNCLTEKGSVADCTIRWGMVPLGTLIFLRKQDGGEKKHGYNDREGNIDHVYIKYAKGKVLHASVTHERVVVRDFADKDIPNGGPNGYGMLMGVVYTGSRVPSDMGDIADSDFPAEEESYTGGVDTPITETFAPPSVQQYVRVQTPNGGRVKIRERHDPSIYKYYAPNGTVMLCTGTWSKDRKYYKVIFNGKERLVDKQYVVPHEKR